MAASANQKRTTVSHRFASVGLFHLGPRQEVENNLAFVPTPKHRTGFSQTACYRSSACKMQLHAPNLVIKGNGCVEPTRTNYRLSIFLDQKIRRGKCWDACRTRNYTARNAWSDTHQRELQSGKNDEQEYSNEPRSGRGLSNTMVGGGGTPCTTSAICFRLDAPRAAFLGRCVELA